MPLPSPETQAKVASDGEPLPQVTNSHSISKNPPLLTPIFPLAAQNFVDTFYEVLNRRHQLAPYYVTTSPRLTAASLAPDISVNGHHVASVSELEALLEKQGTPVHYEVFSFDAQPVNPHFAVGAPDAGGPAAGDKGDRLSFAVQVSGNVKFGRGEDAVEKGFNDSFVLVPHWEAQGRNAARGMRRWLVVSQNLRIL